MEKTVLAVGCFLFLACGCAASQNIIVNPARAENARCGAASDDKVLVAAKGVGGTKADALKDAYRDAVEKAVGQFVDAELIVKNDEVLKDQVLTQSNAYIEGYDLVKEVESEGLVRVSILATVRKSALATKISSFISDRNVSFDGALKKAHAQIESVDRRDVDAAKLMENCIEGVDLVAQTVELSLASAKPVVQKVDGNPNKVRVWYLFQWQIDEERYKVIALKFAQILSQISLSRVKQVQVSKSNVQMESSHRENLNAYLEFRTIGSPKPMSSALKKEMVKRGYRSKTILPGERPEGYDPTKGYCEWMDSSGPSRYLNMEFYSGMIDGELIGWRIPGDRIHYYDRGATVNGRQNNELLAMGIGFKNYTEEGSADPGVGLNILLADDVASSGYKASLFVVDAKVANVINDWMVNHLGARRGRMCNRSLSYAIAFKDKRDRIVSSHNWVVRDGYRMLWNACFVDLGNINGRKPLLVMAPLIHAAAEKMVEWHPFEIDRDLLPEISSVTMERME